MPPALAVPPLPAARPKAAPAPAARATSGGGHIAQLDGWRGVSIVLVLAAHMAPLGPKAWRLNETAAPMGMALFFTLSGFLITSFLMGRPEPGSFLVRRACRILPLALAYLVAVLTLTGAGPEAWAANLLFVTNYRPEFLCLWNSPFWSLCVEIHFYLFVAAVVWLGGRRGLWLMPAACVLVTAARVAADAPVSNYTHLRADEILAGACLALFWNGGTAGAGWLLGRVSPWAWLALLGVASSPLSGPAQFVRPYAAALLMGATLVQEPHRLSRTLLRPELKYLASVSYALYVLHPAAYRGWMDEGSAAVRYLVKRPISLALLFAAAHLSTATWEAWWIGLGKRLTTRR